MNTLMWILAGIAYFVFNYSFALLNIYVWKRWVTLEEKEVNKYGRVSKEYFATLQAPAKVLWPATGMCCNSHLSYAGIFILEDNLKIYLALMTLIGSAIKIVFTIWAWIWIAAMFVLWFLALVAKKGVVSLGNMLSRLPGAKKVL